MKKFELVSAVRSHPRADADTVRLLNTLMSKQGFGWTKEEALKHLGWLDEADRTNSGAFRASTKFYYHKNIIEEALRAVGCRIRMNKRAPGDPEQTYSVLVGWEKAVAS